MIVTSRQNGRVKQIRALRDRRERERCGLCIAEGVQLVTAAAMSAQVWCAIACDERLHSEVARDALCDLRRRGTEILHVSGYVFDSIVSDRYASHGVAAVVRQRWNRLEDLRVDERSWWIALDGVQYPGNLGAVLRTSDAVGCGGAILLGSTADPYDPLAISASRGAVFSQRLVRCDFKSFQNWKRREVIHVIGTLPAARDDYRCAEYRPPFVILMGCESRGLGEQAAICDRTIRIPMAGQCDSLNLAVSAAIVMYEVFGQMQSRIAQSKIIKS